jgi:pimeloyl-ACP methyl ester carboxylesterase
VKRVVVALFVALPVVGCGSNANAASGNWVGGFRLPASAQQVPISVQLRGAKANVALGPGHSGSTTVAARVRGSRIRFSFPGLPANVVFDGRLKGRVFAGTVSQGKLRGTFRLASGNSRVLPALGLYRSAAGAGVAIVQAEGLPTWLVELPSGNIHGLNRSLSTVGTRLGDTSGDGTLAVDAGGLTWTRGGTATRYARVRLHQREVRVGVDAATLTLPEGPGPFPAVAMAHGSGPQTREEFQVFAAYAELLGIAVLADDKRGVGQSQGIYPGESATDSTIEVLARDVQSEARFLASLPQVDPKRVGLLGDSQAGWIIALAAAREPAVRWAVPLVGPTVTPQETDTWGNLAGKHQFPPIAPFAEILAQVRAQGRGGFDPVPYLERLTIPVFWVFGDDDRNVPTQLCVERLQPLQAAHDFSWTVLPMAHALIDLPSGLYSSLGQSRGFAVGLFPAVGEWLRSRRVV